MEQSPETKPILDVLILEPDFWRYVGMRHVAEQARIHVVGERRFEKILTAKRTPPGVPPGVVVVSHKLILEHGIAVIPHVRDLFPDARVLVFGDDDRMDVVVDMLAVGARGFFVASAPSHYFPKALEVVDAGSIWAPREAVALLAYGDDREAGDTSAEVDERSILQMLYEGLSNKEIGARCGLAEVTIKARMSRLYRKYGVNTRVQLLAVAMKRNLIDLA